MPRARVSDHLERPLSTDVLTNWTNNWQSSSEATWPGNRWNTLEHLILVRDRDEAAELANELATEHLHIACDDAEDLLEAIRHAGAIFVGPYSPVAMSTLR